MKQWIFSVISTVILTIVIILISPEGKLGKIIKSVFSIIILIVIIKPIVSLNVNDLNFNFLPSFDVEYEIDNDFLDYFTNKKIEKLKNETLIILKDFGITNAQIEIELLDINSYDYSINLIKIYLENAVINSNLEHIVIIEQIRNKVSENFNLNAQKVVIYE